MFRTSLLLIASLSLAACGGVESLFSTPQTVPIQSAPNDSGYAWSSGGAVQKSTTNQLLVGDGFLNGTAHSFLRFSTALIPPGASITEARLVIGQESILNDPYGNVGPRMFVDQLDFGAALDITEMTAPVVIQPLSVLSTTSDLVAKEANVENAVEYALDNAMPYVDLRIRFEQPTNGDATGDWARLNNENDDGGSGIRPALIVTYTD